LVANSLELSSLFLSQVLYITGRKTQVWEAVEVSGTSKEEIGDEMNRENVVTTTRHNVQ